MPVQLIIVSAIVFGPLSGWLAARRRRPRLAWFLFGTMLGPVAPALLLVAPAGTCLACGAESRGWRRTCTSCGLRLDGTPQPGALPAVVQAHPVGEPAAAAAVAAGPADVAGAAAAPDATPAGAAAATTATQAPSRVPTARWWRATRVSVPPGEGPPVAAGPSSAEAGAPEAEATLETLGAGVLVGGTGGLSIGSRYIIAREVDTLVLQGPVDIDPANVALRRPRRGLEASIIEDRLVISEMVGGRLAFAVAFTTLTGTPGHDFERDIPLSEVRPAPESEPASARTEPVDEAAPPLAPAPEVDAAPEPERVPEVEAETGVEADTDVEPAADVEPETVVEPAPPSDAVPEAALASAADPQDEHPPTTRRIRARRAASGAAPARRSSRRRTDREP